MNETAHLLNKYKIIIRFFRTYLEFVQKSYKLLGVRRFRALSQIYLKRNVSKKGVFNFPFEKVSMGLLAQREAPENYK